MGKQWDEVVAGISWYDVYRNNLRTSNSTRYRSFPYKIITSQVTHKKTIAAYGSRPVVIALGVIRG